MTIYLYATKFMTLPAYTSPLAIFICTDRVCFIFFFGILGHFIPSRPSFSFQLLRKHWSLKVVLRVRTGEREIGASQNIKFKFPCLPTYCPSYQHLSSSSCGYYYCPIYRFP